MERTTSMIIYICFALIAAAIIIAFVASHKPSLCAQNACAGKTNGETFCSNDKATLFTCILDDNGCLKAQSLPCTCVVNNGIASCA